MMDAYSVFLGAILATISVVCLIILIVSVTAWIVKKMHPNLPVNIAVIAEEIKDHKEEDPPNNSWPPTSPSGF